MNTARQLTTARKQTLFTTIVFVFILLLLAGAHADNGTFRSEELESRNISESPQSVGLRKISFSPSVLTGGCQGSTGNLLLTGPAPAGGTIVTLDSTPNAHVPQSVTIPEGETSVSFPVQTDSVVDEELASVSATAGSSSITGRLKLLPVRVASLSFDPNPVEAGSVTIGTLTLSCAAPETIIVRLTSDKGAAKPDVSQIAIPAGAISQQFTVSTSRADLPVTATITALDSNGGLVRAILNLNVLPRYACAGNLIRNGDFTSGIKVVGNGSIPSSLVDHWSGAFESPQIVNATGCGNNGYVSMWGNQVVGEAIRQTLTAPLVPGRRYRLSACVRWLKSNNAALPQYVRFKVRASDGPLPSYTSPAAVIGIIGQSPSTPTPTGLGITSTGWAKVILQDWVATGSYNTITINPENNNAVNDGTTVSWGQIDNVCLEDVTPGRRVGSISGRVIDTLGRPLSQVLVQVPERPTVLTNSQGRFTVSGIPLTERLAVSFSSAGFMNSTQIFRVDGRAVQNPRPVVLHPRANAISLDAERGGRVRFPNGATVTIPANALVDNVGQPLHGTVRISLTHLDVSDREQLKSVPGDFSAQMSDGSVRMLESFGVFEIVAWDESDQRADLAPGKTAKFELPIPPSLRNTAPRSSKLFSFDRASGRWIEEGVVRRPDLGLVYSGTINRFDWSWNVDDPLDTTCITVKFVNVYSHPGPIANALVEATGVNYNTISSGYTNSQGLVCLLVKINAPISITAYDPYPIGPLYVTSPNIVSGAADCGDPVRCPLVMTVESDR